MVNKTLSHKKGLTLLEVVISISILMIILAPVLSMVYSTVKTNKNAEDKQKAQALVQKYIEDIKANAAVSPGEKVYNEDIFEIHVNITQVSDYNFPNSNNTSGEAITINNDMEIIMDSQNLSVYGKNKSFLKSFSVSGNKVITVIDSANSLGVIEGFNADNSIDTQSNTSPMTKINSNASTIKVENSSNYTLSIHGKNYCSSGDLIFYCMETNNNGQAYVINNIGSVKALYNVPAQDSSSNSSSGRVYNIGIDVYKNGALVTSNTAYKTVLD